MKIFLAKTAGFCFGVDKAVKTVYNNIVDCKDGGSGGICTLGPIIHNQSVINDLEKRGVFSFDNVCDIPSDKTVIIRAHGITKAQEDELKERNLKYVDATCPFVKKIHQIVDENSNENNVTIVCGDENHPEVRGFVSKCHGEVFVVDSPETLKNLFDFHPELLKKEVICVEQTTFSVDKAEKCKLFLKKVSTNLKYFDTICLATLKRQQEAKGLSKVCDMMLVIGGKHSSNTQKLVACCEENCPTFLIENAKDLSEIDFSDVFNLGITAGASTPVAIIEEVLCTMNETNNEQTTGEELDFDAALEQNLAESMSGDAKVVGTVISMTETEIQVDFGRKYTGVVKKEEYSDDPNADHTKELKVGDKINLIIMKTNDDEGYVTLSKRRYDRMYSWDKLVEAKKNDDVITAQVAQVVNGGILVFPFGARVFIPASQTGLSKNESLETLVGKDVDFKLIELKDDRRKKAVGSIKVVERAKRKAAEDAFWAQAEVGQEYTGRVTAIKSYGAFVDIGDGVEGMIHITELSWNRIKSPAEVVKVGDIVKVKILDLVDEDAKDEEAESETAEAVEVAEGAEGEENEVSEGQEEEAKEEKPAKKAKRKSRKTRRISLGYKRFEDNPWELFKANHKVGDVVDVKITGFATYGAFAVMVEDGTKGLIHISQITDHRIDTPQSVLSVDQICKVQISEIDVERNRVNFSIRALMESEQEKADEEAREVIEETSTAAEELVYSTED